MASYLLPLFLSLIIAIVIPNSVALNSLELQRRSAEGYREEMKKMHRARLAQQRQSNDRNVMSRQSKSTICDIERVMFKAICGCYYLNKNGHIYHDLKKQCIGGLEVGMAEIESACKVLMSGEKVDGQALTQDIDGILGICSASDIKETDSSETSRQISAVVKKSFPINFNRNLDHLKTVVRLLRALEETLKNIFNLKPSNNSRMVYIKTRREAMKPKTAKLVTYNNMKYGYKM